MAGAAGAFVADAPDTGRFTLSTSTGLLPALHASNDMSTGVPIVELSVKEVATTQ